jgi:erythromycin esterase
LWAHNGHVSKGISQVKSMGSFLNQKYSSDMIVFGFGFYEGKYTAIGKNGLNIYSTSLPQPGSFEWVLHNTGKEQLVVDLRKFSNSPLSSLLKDNIDFRSIGAMAVDDAFYPIKITQDYDAIIYFDKTTPSACFGKPKK